ncbi:PREDICTED: sushi domain-containing protein 3-like [Tinamus guttatus]|uniref:sushi domain-containing protein 3-like n=1 Tax=Tinamus guttatus TaxID=94827 RepID=UPI00052EAFCC|nr:PREDICTED: sushi domain-containing protein 3-like [Tinamus guttatus]
MTGRRSAGGIALCLLPWSCLSVACGDAAAASPSAGPVLPGAAANGTSGHSNGSAECTALVPPRYGSYDVERGSGSSLGSVVAYWCQEGYQLVGSERLVCLRRDGVSAWSHHPPHCEAVPRPHDKGFRVAVVASLVSGAIILALSVSFAVCCWRDRTLRSCALRHEAARGPQLGRKRRGGRQHDPAAPERGKIAFGRLTHYHRRDYHLSALSSSVFPGAFAGCNNPAFQRSPESFPKPPAQSWHAEAPAFPQAVPHPGAPRSGPAYAQLLHTPSTGLLSATPGRADLPRDLLPLYYRGHEDHKLLNKLQRPV